MFALVALFACPRTEDPAADRDGDGFSILQGDCDDADPAAYPGAIDPLGDRLDQDCDGVDGPSERLAGFVGVTSPGLEASLQFGFDVATGDLDGDGQHEVLVGTQQVDSTGDQFDVRPGHAMLFDDDFHRLASWDGEAERDYLGVNVAIVDHAISQVAFSHRGGAWVLPWDSPSGVAADSGWHLEGEIDGYNMDVHLASADVVGTPNRDLLMACGTLDSWEQRRGAVCIMEGPITEDRLLTDSDIIVGTAERMGSTMTGGDLDGDGVNELVSGATGESDDAGAVFAFAGPLRFGGLQVADASERWNGEQPGDWLGHRAALADFDGDGSDEVAASAVAWPGQQRRGRVYVLDPGASTADSPVVIDGEPGLHHLGFGLTTGDFDGDGLDDLAVGAPAIFWDGTRPGRTVVFYGPLSGHLTPADAGRSFAGEMPGDGAGLTLATGDLNGDAQDDLLIAAPFNDEAAIDSGKVYLLTGPLLP